MLKDVIIKNQFEPGLPGIFLNPFYIARKNLLKNIKSLAPAITGKTLDVGCGTKPYEKYFGSSEYIGLEIESTIHRDYTKADKFYGGGEFPFADSEFDSVVTNQVLEHVFTPGIFLSEINRVLKKEGTLLLTVPFAWDEHEQPYDYARYSSFALRFLFDKHGFEIISEIKSANNLSAIFQLLGAYIYKLTHKHRPLKILSTVFLIAPVTLVGLLLGKIFPSNDDFYLDNIILAKKKKDI